MSILEKRIYFLRDIQQAYIPKNTLSPQKKTKWTQKLLLIRSDKSGGLLLPSLLRTERVSFPTLGSSILVI